MLSIGDDIAFDGQETKPSPMSSLEAASYFATLVGLICNWRDEREAQADDRFQDFISWLVNHKFENIRDRIFESDELQRQLNELLRQDYGRLGDRLDSISSAISSISDRIDTFGQVARAFRSPSDAISDQALAILKIFDQKQALRMYVTDRTRLGPECVFLPSGGSVRVGEPRFLEADISTLLRFGFIELVGHNSSGSPMYCMTRSGTSVAASIEPVTIGGSSPPS